MEKVKKHQTNQDDTPPLKQPQEVNHTERIKSQVLAKIGRPCRLERVEVCQHHNGNYRVNIWEQPEPNKSIAVTIAPRIGSSYYLKVSDTGEILHSTPPLAKTAT